MKHRCVCSMFLAAVLILSAAMPASMNRAEAQTTRSGHEIDYYSDATFTDMVGFVVFCKSGQTIRNGQVTQFRKVITEDFC